MALQDGSGKNGDDGVIEALLRVLERRVANARGLAPEDVLGRLGANVATDTLPVFTSAKLDPHDEADEMEEPDEDDLDATDGGQGKPKGVGIEVKRVFVVPHTRGLPVGKK